jgi:hypothetical protein
MGFFDRQQAVADPGYNRWLFSPAALAVHLSIGQVYAFSVFKLPAEIFHRQAFFQDKAGRESAAALSALINSSIRPSSF